MKGVTRLTWHSVVLVASLVTITAAAALTGCASDPRNGYVFGSTYDSGVRTVTVPVFRNTTFTPGIEQTLTDAITKEILARTPWRVVSRGNADTELVGEIGGYDLFAISRTPGVGFTQEQSVTIRVNFVWRDVRDGTVRAERRNFSATSTFIPTPGIAGEPGERIEIGEREAIEELARAIVTELRAEF